MLIDSFPTFGVLNEDKKSMSLMGHTRKVNLLSWISPEEHEKVKQSWDSVDAPTSPYKVQPQNQGRLIWLSGPGGAGKSTTGFKLAKEKNFVYYEADCYLLHCNPYVSLEHETPTDGIVTQSPLRGKVSTRVGEISQISRETRF